MRIIVLLLSIVLSGMLTACGFELRSAAVLPLEFGKLYVQADSVLRNDVEVFLQGSNTELVSDRPQATLTLTMSNPRYQRRVLSVDPDTGHEREFELSYSLDVVATGTNGQVYLEPQTLSQQRDYVFDAAALMGSSQEEAVLRIEMRRDLVRQLLYRLRAAATTG